MTFYADYQERADKCELNAMKAESEWARDFWKKTAEELRHINSILTLTIAGAQNE